MNNRSHAASDRQRTNAAHSNESGVYSDSCLHIEHKKYFLAVKGTPVSLTRKEFRIVSRLIAQIDRIVTLEELWNYAWDANNPLERKKIHVFISRVRRKLQVFGMRIDSVVDVGYIFSHGTCCSRKREMRGSEATTQ